MARFVISRFAIPAAVVADCIDLKCCKRSELPIYVPECKDDPKAMKAADLAVKKPSALEDNVMTVRKTLQTFVSELQYYEEEGLRYVNEGVDQAQWLVKYLGEEDNIAPKGPAIAIGGLTGFIFAVRGGLFKKVVFTTAGALGMAAVCYPKEAAHYSEAGLVYAKQYVTIAYNFVYGDGAQQATVRKEGQALASAMEISNVVVKSHEEAVQKSCHCPIGACLHPKEDEKAVHPPILPYPPPNTPSSPDVPQNEKK